MNLSDSDFDRLLTDPANRAEYRRAANNRNGHFDYDQETNRIKWVALDENFPQRRHGIMRIVRSGGVVSKFNLCACHAGQDVD